MYRPIPPIQAAPDELKRLLHDERQPQKRQRLHALYLLASKQATSRSEVAALLGVYRETVGHWLDRYTQGGLPALLEVYVPQGKRSQLPPPVLAELEQRLRQPQGCGSYHEIRHWLQHEHGILITYKTLANVLRRTYQSHPNVARPSHIKPLDAGATFREDVTTLVHAAIPVTNTLPVQLQVQDERRWG